MASYPRLPLAEEGKRQEAVDDLAIDPLLKTALDEITRNAARRFGVPMAAITILDRDRQEFAARVGIDEPSTPREDAICNWTITAPAELTVIEDAATDTRLSSNSLVHGAFGLRFYAGVPITLRGGHRVGALCVLDTQPNYPTESQLQDLRSMAETVAVTLNARRFRRRP